jgi:hypothetical protein
VIEATVVWHAGQSTDRWTVYGNLNAGTREGIYFGPDEVCCAWWPESVHLWSVSRGYIGTVTYSRDEHHMRLVARPAITGELHIVLVGGGQLQDLPVTIREAKEPEPVVGRLEP